MKNISVVVPIFHGRKYINNMIAQLEKCTSVSDKYALELLLVNDDPSEKIKVVSSEEIAIKVIETDRNRGVHASRVRGLKESNGDYILFLDQDDRIVPEYFNSQLLHLGEGDAVVCRLFHEGRQFYDRRMPFEQVITREFIISVRNPIISPGQVLLRKNKIPEAWKRAELRNNGADDWLLWLCMLGENQRFSLNDEILFEHVVEGNNESINVNHMINSERELYQIVSEKEILTDTELQGLYRAVQNAEDSHIKLLSKFQKMFFVYDQWLRLQEEGKYIHEYLKRCKVRYMAIYGDSYIGKRLYHSLRDNGVEVCFFIDKNAEYLEEEIPVYLPQAGLPKVDLILISLVEEVEKIKMELAWQSETKICSLEELFTEMKQESYENFAARF